MKLFFTILVLHFLLISKSQDTPFDHYKEDTIHLSTFHAHKIVAYKLDSVTFYVSFDDYFKDFRVLWKIYHEQNIGSNSSTNEYVNPDFESRWKLIDSVYKVLKSRKKSADTIFLSRSLFQRVGLDGSTELLASLLEQNHSAISDRYGILHQTIIRQTGTWYRGPLAAWGGRRYYLPGKNIFFIEGTDWIS